MDSKGRPVSQDLFNVYKIKRFQDDGAHPFTWAPHDDLPLGKYYFKAWTAGLEVYSQSLALQAPGTPPRRHLVG